MESAGNNLKIAFDRHGTGEPLLLIHCIGLDRRCWDPLIPKLAARHEVLVIDLPGHGASPPPPSDIPRTPIGYATILSAWLDDLGADAVHVAGYSVGGWTALELGKRGRARSVTGLAPAGLWPRRMPVPMKAQLWLDYYSGRAFGWLIPYVLRTALGRKLTMWRKATHPECVPADAAIHISRSLAGTPLVAEHMRATMRARFEGGNGITVPVTVAYGDKEKLIPERGRRHEELPEHARWIQLPDCGHLPFWDDTDRVVATILDGAQASPRQPIRE